MGCLKLWWFFLSFLLLSYDLLIEVVFVYCVVM